MGKLSVSSESYSGFTQPQYVPAVNVDDFLFCLPCTDVGGGGGKDLVALAPDH